MTFTRQLAATDVKKKERIRTMSRRITTRTEITDKELAIEALKSAGISYQVDGDTINLTSGTYTHATLDLQTGTIEGDSDYGHSSRNLGLLRQHYSEAKVKAKYLREGTIIDSREVNSEGDIVLMWHMA